MRKLVGLCELFAQNGLLAAGRELGRAMVGVICTAMEGGRGLGALGVTR